MAEPTDVQLRDYVAKLPQIYKDILCAFPKVNSRRRREEAVAESSLIGTVMDDHENYLADEVGEALHNFAESKMLTIETKQYLTPGGGGTHSYRIIKPTPLGERLIKAQTGVAPLVKYVPKLPIHSWS